MAAITDAFTDTNGTDLAAHVSPGGQTWTNRNVTLLRIQSNHVESVAGASTSAIYEWNIGALSKDLTASIDYAMPLASPDDFFFSLTIRGTSAAGPTFGGGPIAIVGRTGGALQLKLNEDAAPLATVLIPEVDDGLVHTLTVTAQGGLLRVYIDAVKKLTAYSATYSGAQGQTRINVRNGLAGMPAGFYLDNASIDAAPAQPLTLASLVSAATFSRNMVPIPPTVMAFLIARHRPVPGALSLGGTGGSAPPIEGQLWPRGQKSG
jgi:hypothetical protein